jgi:hypothetical protein
MPSEKEVFMTIVGPLLTDSTAIANSALTLAIERCTDLEMNPIVCLIMLKMLADKNAKALSADLPPHLHTIAKHAGIDLDNLHDTLEDGLKKVLATRELSL